MIKENLLFLLLSHKHCLLILFEIWDHIYAKNDTPKQLGLHHVGWTNGAGAGASAMCNDTQQHLILSI